MIGKCNSFSLSKDNKCQIYHIEISDLNAAKSNNITTDNPDLYYVKDKSRCQYDRWNELVIGKEYAIINFIIAIPSFFTGSLMIISKLLVFWNRFD